MLGATDRLCGGRVDWYADLTRYAAIMAKILYQGLQWLAMAGIQRLWPYTTRESWLAH